MTVKRIVAIGALSLAIAACTPATSGAPGGSASSAPASQSSGAPPTPSASATASASIASSAALPANFPVGAWTMTVTPDDLRAAGITDQGAITENSGTFVLTFTAKGQWTVVQQNGDPARWPVFRGRVTATRDGSFDATTEFPPEYAGEVVPMTWQLEGDALTLHVPGSDDPILKANWESHPWQRVPTS
jgi:hypothetical protein